MPIRASVATGRAAFIALLLAALFQTAHGSDAPPNELPVVDAAQVRAAGIRKLESRRLELYTDLPSDPSVDELPTVFDQAFDLWCRYFGLDPQQYPTWRMRACLMDNPDRFRESGLLPADLPKFLHGYTRGHESWLNNQPSDYYRRHLLLHEGVHSFMFTLLGERAAPWYVEGMAELLATHRWQDGRLELPYYPKKPAEVPKLGRIELVQRDVAAGRTKSLDDIFAYGPQAHLQVEPYGWSWAAASFLDSHPRYRERFRRSRSLARDSRDFNQDFRRPFADDALELADEWRVFAADVVHDYDFRRTAIDFARGQPMPGKSIEVTVEADRGWQNAGVRLDGARKYTLAATGRYQVANTAKPWFSEPNGVSIRYIHGKPLGVLLAAIRPDDATDRTSAFLHPIVVGSGTQIQPPESGTLFFRINDSSGELADNSGQATVQITAE